MSDRARQIRKHGHYMIDDCHIGISSHGDDEDDDGDEDIIGWKEMPITGQHGKNCVRGWKLFSSSTQ